MLYWRAAHDCDVKQRRCRKHWHYFTVHRLETAIERRPLEQTITTCGAQITDALVELGNYSGAVKSAQKMVDLRPDRFCVRTRFVLAIVAR